MLRLGRGTIHSQGLNELETSAYASATSSFAPMPNGSVFGQVPGSRPCVVGSGGKPAYVILFRHCDEGFNTQKAECAHSAAYTGCQGCEYISNSDCATNDCNGLGIQRAYGYGKWLACFGARTGAPVAGIFSQNPPSSANNYDSNGRPMATASMLYDSLLRLTGADPSGLCWMAFDRKTASVPNSSNKILPALASPAFNGKTVAIVWDHGNIQYILQALGVNITGWWWDKCCYDQAVVITMANRSMTTYQLNTFGGNDPCMRGCQAAKSAYPGCPGPWPTPTGGASSLGSHNDSNAGGGLGGLAAAIDGRGAGQVNPGAKHTRRGVAGYSSNAGTASNCASNLSSVGVNMVAPDLLHLAPTSTFATDANLLDTTFDTSANFDTSASFAANSNVSFDGSSLSF